MRRIAAIALSALLAVSFAAPPALAQIGGRNAEKEAEEAAKKKKRDEEWNQPSAPLPALRNAGPCPFVKVLYDAGRYHEFKDNRESAGAVMWTGEIQGISAGCQYKDDEPIKVAMEVLFALGKGPQATDSRKNFRYWIAVTDRNRAVIAKEYFDLPVNFGNGERVMVREKIEGITIPRAGVQVSGSNFEVLIGFDVTPQMTEFNRDGKRFRVNAGSPAPAAGSPGASANP
jgi:hypothetical protein